MIELLGRFDMRRLARRLPAAMSGRVQVLVDGEPVRGVAACDTRRGWADVQRRDDRGRPVMLAGAAQIERRHGRVRVVVNHPTPAELDQLGSAGIIIA